MAALQEEIAFLKEQKAAIEATNVLLKSKNEKYEKLFDAKVKQSTDVSQQNFGIISENYEIQQPIEQI